ncbi:nuclear transport factor 2 family protein [Agromyces sp. SYSU T00266]|uniref:nuclear transport factor 2 family protein n=1 Tax=Agromyces zhanjiangensis TaxID=3158562 RepID=UPI003391735B
MSPQQTVLAAMSALFGRRDIAALDEYVAPGAELRALVSGLPPSYRFEPVRVIAEGEFVVVHGLHHGLGPVPLVGFDLFRLVDGRIVEHWAARTPVVDEPVGGRSQTDGPVEPTGHDRTAENRALVVGWIDRVLIGGDRAVRAEYVSTERYAQHNPEVGDGLDGLAAAVAAWAETGRRLTYVARRQVVAEGDFVFARCEGDFGGPVVFNDLWRVEGGRIVEHWDVIAPTLRPVDGARA